jgi:hypothetical protein
MGVGPSKIPTPQSRSSSVKGAEDLALEKKAEIKKLKAEALELDDKARLEDTSVFQEPYVRINKKGERKEYLRWRCSWMENGKSHKVYLDSCNRLTREQALNRAKEKKAKALGLENGWTTTLPLKEYSAEP